MYMKIQNIGKSTKMYVINAINAINAINVINVCKVQTVCGKFKQVRKMYKGVRKNVRCGCQKLGPLLKYIHFGVTSETTYIFGELSEAWPTTGKHIHFRWGCQKPGTLLKYTHFDVAFRNLAYY